MFDNWKSVSRTEEQLQNMRTTILEPNLFSEALFLKKAAKVFKAPGSPHFSEKEKARILADMWKWYPERFFTPKYYLAFRFYEKTPEQIETFFSSYDAVMLCEYMNDTEAAELLNHKGKTFEHYREFYRREALFIREDSDFDAYTEFIRRHPSFFSKPENGACGRGVQRNTPKNAGEAEILFASFVTAFPGGLLLEEPIRQHPAIAAYHPDTVNTFRVITHYENEKLTVLTVLLRIGKDGMSTDNISGGGRFCRIDPRSGKVIAAFENVFEPLAHPEAVGLPAIGTKIEDFEGLLQFVAALCKVNPGARFVGWDVARAVDGWCLVEGNSHCQMLGAQCGLETGLYPALCEARRKCGAAEYMGE